jgi:hypothetical protein
VRHSQRNQDVCAGWSRCEPTDTLFGLLLAIGGSLLALALIYYGHANVYLVPVVCAGIAFLFVLGKYLEFGLYTLLGASLLLEQFQIFGLDDPITLKLPFFINLNQTTGVGALVMNPIEVLLSLIVGLWFLRAALSRHLTWRPIPNFNVALLFLGMLIFYTLMGLARGGDFKVALWEIRALYYLCAVYFLGTQLIRTRRQINICIGISMLMIVIKGLQGCWRFFVTLDGQLTVPAITGHEDALFIVTMFVFVASLFLLGRYCRTLWLLVAMCPTTLLTFFLTQRRIAYGTLAISLGMVFLLLPRSRQWFAIKVVLPLVPLLMLYTAVYWNSTKTIATPIRQTRSIFESGEKEDSSNTYRDAENINLKTTIRAFPMGVGFGNKYLVVVPLAAVDFPLWDYIPHNCIYWIWVKTGFGGFVVFWLFFGTAMMQAIIYYRKMSDTYYKAYALVVLTFISSQLMVAYYDLQITFYRNMIYLGMSMALLVAMAAVDAREQNLSDLKEQQA